MTAGWLWQTDQLVCQKNRKTESIKVTYQKNAFTYLLIASKLQIIERIIPQRILKTSMSCNAMFTSIISDFGTHKIKNEVKVTSIIADFGTHKIKNEVKED